jgi:hypothetical protein
MESWQNGEKALQDISKKDEVVESEHKTRTNEVSKEKRRQLRSKDNKADEDAIPGIPANFDLSENPCNYTTSGSLRQQSSRQVEDDEAGRKTTYTT